MHSGENKSRIAPAFVSLWWLHPVWIVAVPLVMFSLIAFLLPEPDYRENWRSAKVFGSSDLMLCLAVAAAFSAGCLLAALADVTGNRRRLGTYGGSWPVRPEVAIRLLLRHLFLGGWRNRNSRTATSGMVKNVSR